jgi:hypothetical protein
LAQVQAVQGGYHEIVLVNDIPGVAVHFALIKVEDSEAVH